MDALNNLEQNINTLLSRYSSLQQDYARLQEENEEQRREIMRTHAELVELQNSFTFRGVPHIHR